MTTDEGPESPESGESRDDVVAFDLDNYKHEPTGDPVLDRGLEMSLAEVEEAVADPAHEDHEAAKAAQAHLNEKVSGTADAIFGSQFQRIGENLSAAITPGIATLFSARASAARSSRSPNSASTSTPASAAAQAALPYVPMPSLPVPPVDDTPQQTLVALLGLSERMSEMVRLTAEQRDVALAQIELARADASNARKSERRMLWLTWLALAGTWVAVVVALISP